MRAVRVPTLGAIDNGALVEVDDPVPGPGQVVVAIEAAPVNFVDIVTITGRYQFTPDLPYTPGKGPAGTIQQVASDVTGLAAGDRVLAMAEYGGYAEQVVIDAAQVYALPAAVGATTAAALAVSWDTAWMALRDRVRLQPGDRVLVTGATGAVGQAAIELARAMGAARVLATARTHHRPPGVDPSDVIDLSLGPPRDTIRKQVHAALGDEEGVDVVVDTLGGEVFDGAIRSLAWRGRLVTVGFASGVIPTLKANYLLLKNIEVSGIQISDYRRRRPDLLREGIEEVLRLVAAGQVRTPAVETHPLAEWATAMRRLEARATQARLVLRP